MKAMTTLTTLILLLGVWLGPQPARAQAPLEFRFTNLQATASSVPFRIGTGKQASYVDTGMITISGSGRGTFDRARRNARVTWEVTASAPGLQAKGIGPLKLRFVGVGVYDRERQELFMVDAAGMGGGASAAPTCSQCVQNNNIASKPSKDSDVDWERGIGGPVVFRSLAPDDLDRHPMMDLLLQASQGAGLGLARQDAEAMMRQYRQEPTKELVVYYPETGETFSFDLQGRATLEFGSR
ncbi:MAG: hypothetical protein ACREK5_09370 [Gemmatimonadota bacterium]